jgi:hypothetical protein
MTEGQLALSHVNKLLMLALLAGLCWRGRAGLCWTFPVYVCAALAGNAAPTFWPGHFYTASFWILKEGVYSLLKAAIAIELAYRSLHAFPGAWRTARLALGGLLLASTLAIAVAVPSASYRTLYEWQPRVGTAGVWLFTATALLVVWYQVPVRSFQRALMLGFAVYLLFSVTLLGVLGRHGWSVRAELGLVDSAAWGVLMVFWTVAAWRPDEASVPGTGGRDTRLAA